MFFFCFSRSIFSAQKKGSAISRLIKTDNAIIIVPLGSVLYLRSQISDHVKSLAPRNKDVALEQLRQLRARRVKWNETTARSTLNPKKRKKKKKQRRIKLTSFQNTHNWNLTFKNLHCSGSNVRTSRSGRGGLRWRGPSLMFFFSTPKSFNLRLPARNQCVRFKAAFRIEVLVLVDTLRAWFWRAVVLFVCRPVYRCQLWKSASLAFVSPVSSLLRNKNE